MNKGSSIPSNRVKYKTQDVPIGCIWEGNLVDLCIQRSDERGSGCDAPAKIPGRPTSSDEAWESAEGLRNPVIPSIRSPKTRRRQYYRRRQRSDERGSGCDGSVKIPGRPTSSDEAWESTEATWEGNLVDLCIQRSDERGSGCDAPAKIPGRPTSSDEAWESAEGLRNPVIPSIRSPKTRRRQYYRRRQRSDERGSGCDGSVKIPGRPTSSDEAWESTEATWEGNLVDLCIQRSDERGSGCDTPAKIPGRPTSSDEAWESAEGLRIPVIPSIRSPKTRRRQYYRRRQRSDERGVVVTAL